LPFFLFLKKAEIYFRSKIRKVIVDTFVIKDSSDRIRISEERSSVVYSDLFCFENEITSNLLSLKYTIYGKEEFHFSNKSYSVPKGSLLVTPPQQKIEGEVKGNRRTQAVCVFFDQQLIAEANRSIVNPLDIDHEKAVEDQDFIPLLLRENEHRLHDAFLQIVNPVNQMELNSEVLLDLGMTICSQQSQVQKQYNQLHAVRLVTKQEIIQRLFRAKHFIEDACMDTIDLESIAESAFLSKFHLLRYFKEAFGITPHQYVIHCRLEKAVDLIVNQRFSIGEIATKVGFADSPTFSKAFKKKYGYNPSMKLRNF